MVIRNRYIFRSKILEVQLREFLWLFCADLTATQIAQVSGLNRNTVNRIIRGILERIVLACKEEPPPLSGEVEVDQSYFGAHREHGVRGCGARGKVIVFGIIKRQLKVYTEIVPDCSQTILLGIIRGHVAPASVFIRTVGRRYGLVDIGYSKHYRVQHGANEFANEKVISRDREFLGLCENSACSLVCKNTPANRAYK